MRDGSLGTVHSCVAIWDGVVSSYRGPDAEAFNLRTGVPESDVFSTNEGCVYDEYSRLVAEPGPEAFTDGTETFISYDPISFADTEQINLYADMHAGSRFEVRYYFHVVDAYDAESKRANITSMSDPEGEWAALREVAGETNSMPSATSDLYIGKVRVSRDSGNKGSGDGSVWVPSGDSVSVAYLDDKGVVKATSETSPPPSPTPLVAPTPTEVPGLYGNPYPSPTSTIAPGHPERSVSVKFARVPSRSHEEVVFFVRDDQLGTTSRCVVQWKDIPEDVPDRAVGDSHRFKIWNVVTGEPIPGAFSRGGCEYDGSTPIARPLEAEIDGRALSPAVEVPDIGDPTQHGLVSIRAAASKGSTVTVSFHYELPDSFSEQARRARVYSSSDREGEWAAIREIASEEDYSEAAATHLFWGRMLISEDPESLANGDGRVRVRSRSRLSIEYYDGVNLDEPLARASIGLDLPTPTQEPRPTVSPLPTPTPIPAVNPLLLLIGAGIAILVVLLGSRRPVAPSD